MAAQQHTGNSGNFAEDREKASRAGHIGGQHSSGKFTHDRERAVEAGRKGGQSRSGHSSSGRTADVEARDQPHENVSAAGGKGGHTVHHD